MSSNNFEEEIKRLNKEIETNPNDAKAYFNRACSKCKLKNYLGAIADLLKALFISLKTFLHVRI